MKVLMSMWLARQFFGNEKEKSSHKTTIPFAASVLHNLLFRKNEKEGTEQEEEKKKEKKKKKKKKKKRKRKRRSGGKRKTKNRTSQKL